MTASTEKVLSKIHEHIRKDFDTRKVILSFDEYLGILIQNPKRHLRASAQYLLEMMDYYGRTELQDGIFRFHLFDRPIDGLTEKLVGQEEVQTRIYNSIHSFVRQKFNNKLILLHGPNGSAKSTIVHGLMAGLESYSQEDAGALYTFNWIFPVERFTKKGIGIRQADPQDDNIRSYAHFTEEDIAARFPSELKDHPFLLIPMEHRKQMLEQLLGQEEGGKIYASLPVYLTKGDLGHRSKLIFNSLLNAHEGDYQKVLRHIQVERIFLSRRYRKSLVTIEPQLHVDAQFNQLTYNKSLGSLSSTLQSLNLFELSGDLVDANRGIVEYSDLLKRPVDGFKYLLGACESGSVTVGPTIAYLDCVMLGSSNELQLDAFKEFPDFSSFKARIDLIRVPYLLSVSKEREIYQIIIDQVTQDKHVAPHVDWTLAMWAVLTRLKKPNSINYPPALSNIISNLTPLEKATLYDTGDLPVSLTPDERKNLRAHFRKLLDEYALIPYYEGRMGASVREIRSTLIDAVNNPEFACLTPLAALHELEQLVKRVSEYEFLKQDVKDGYHDAVGFINTVREEYLNHLDKEIRDCIGLYDSKQWEDFIRRYVLHISHLLRKERVRNPVTNKSEDPDASLISEFESIVVAPQGAQEIENFRKNIIAAVGAWSLDHPKSPVDYQKIFPQYWSKLEQHYFKTQRSVLHKMQVALQVDGTDAFDPYSEGSRLAKQTVDNLKSKFGYCDLCAREIIFFLLRMRYQ